MRCSIADGIEKDLGGEKEDGEQRILFGTGGDDGEDDDDCKSSKKLDLFPHTTADMLCRKKSNSSQQQQQQQQFFYYRLAHADSKFTNPTKKSTKIEMKKLKFLSDSTQIPVNNNNKNSDFSPIFQLNIENSFV